MFIMLQAILKVLLFKYCGQDDISIGTPIAGRVHEDLQDQVGLYLNNLVLRDRVDDRQPFSAFLQEVKKTTFEAFNHQLYPYDKIIEDLKVPYDKSRNPLYDVLLSMSNFDVRDTRTKNSRLSQILIEEDVVLPNTISKLDLSFFVDEHEKDISLVIEYRTDLFAAHTIARLILLILQ
jgi:non-ribosomal peptide synthetase component F